MSSFGTDELINLNVQPRVQHNIPMNAGTHSVQVKFRLLPPLSIPPKKVRAENPVYILNGMLTLTVLTQFCFLVESGHNQRVINHRQVGI